MRRPAPTASTTKVNSEGMHQHPTSVLPQGLLEESSCKLSSRHESADLLRSATETLETPAARSGRGGRVFHHHPRALLPQCCEESASPGAIAPYAQAELP